MQENLFSAIVFWPFIVELGFSFNQYYILRFEYTMLIADSRYFRVFSLYRFIFLVRFMWRMLFFHQYANVNGKCHTQQLPFWFSFFSFSFLCIGNFPTNAHFSHSSKRFGKIFIRKSIKFNRKPQCGNNFSVYQTVKCTVVEWGSEVMMICILNINQAHSFLIVCIMVWRIEVEGSRRSYSTTLRRCQGLDK